ncbi:MAG: hypothetical protein GVY36_15190 [Verrucomicrobia bacterium]|jgi:hypothetical protein|nr:hypothetical protein [Verrucomicrobiota bacterium]
MLKKIAALFAALGLLVLTGSGAPLNVHLDDSVDLHLSLRSPAETRADWATHPLAKLSADPQLKAFFAPLFEDASDANEESFTEVMENEFGLTWDELFELLPGQITLSWFNMPELILEQTERPELAIMAEFAGDAERLEELMQVQFERNAAKQKEINPAIEHVMIEESFMGETLHLDETFDGEKTYIEDGYALVDGIFILATPETRLRSVVEAIKAGPESPLVRTIPYQRAREEGGRGDLSLYLNLASILPPLNAALLEQSMASGAAMFGLSEKSLDAALSLESMQAFFLDVDLIESGLSSHSGIIYREKAGLLSLLTYRDGPLPQADYVPEDIYSTSISSMDFGAMLAQLETLLGGASPTLPPMIDMQLQNVRSQTGVDLRSSVLENFSDSMVSLVALPDDQRGAAALYQPDQVFVVGVRDAEALSGALKALIDLVPGARDQIETQRFAGQTIQTIRGRPNPNMPEVQANDVSYVITRSKFIFNVGDASLLKEVLTRMESGETGFWQNASTELLFEPIGEDGAVSRSYVDLEKIVQPILQIFVQTAQLGAGNGELKMENIPENLEMPFHVVSEVNEAPDGIFSRSLMIEREASK